MLDAANLVELFSRRVATSGDAVAIRHRADDRWSSLSWNAWQSRARRIAAGLVVLGAQPRDRVAILGETSVEWLFADIAIQMVGAITVPIHGSEPPDRCRHMLEDARARFLFVEDMAQLDRILAGDVALASLETIVVMRPETRTGESRPEDGSALAAVVDASMRRILALDELALAGEEALGQPVGGTLEMRAVAIRPDDVSTIVYTSGTAGLPRGVMTTHRSYLAILSGMAQALPVEQGDAQLLTLPLSHIRGVVAYRTSIMTGAVLGLWEGPQRLVEDLGVVRPTFLFTTPWFCEKVHSRVLTEAREKGGIEQAMLHWALDVAREWLEVRRAGGVPGRILVLKHRAADQLMLRRVRDIFGGRLRFLIVGGAPLRRDISDFLCGAGVLVLESYGLTEATAYSHVNRTFRHKPGSVGTPLAGVHVKIADDGEILLRGPSVMAGYWRGDEPPSLELDEEGWLPTGDLGSADREGFLTITGRKRDIIVTANGTKIWPVGIEHRLRASPFVSNALVYGEGRGFLSAILTLDEQRVRQFAAERRLPGTSFRELAQHPDVYALVDGIIQEQNAQLPAAEQVRKFAILDHDFSRETGELTHTMKLRRRHTIDKHRALLESFYRETF